MKRAFFLTYATFLILCSTSLARGSAFENFFTSTETDCGTGDVGKAFFKYSHEKKPVFLGTTKTGDELYATFRIFLNPDYTVAVFYERIITNCKSNIYCDYWLDHAWIHATWDEFDDPDYGPVLFIEGLGEGYLASESTLQFYFYDELFDGLTPVLASLTTVFEPHWSSDFGVDFQTCLDFCPNASNCLW